MNYLTKSLIQNIFSLLPNNLGTPIYKGLQKKLGTIYTKDHSTKFYRAIEALKFKENRGVDLSSKTILEIGTGHSPTASIAFWLLGFKEVYTIDTDRHLDKECFFLLLKWIYDNEDDIYKIEGISKKRVDLLLRLYLGPFEEISQNLEKNGFSYMAPLFLRNANFKSRYFDFIYSYDVLEHVPNSGIIEIFEISKIILSKSGFMIHRINYADHFAKNDPNISKINFLRFNKIIYKILAGNKFMYMNRLRDCQFVKIFDDMQLDIIQKKSYIDLKIKKQILKKSINIHSDFNGINIKSLSTLSSDFVLKPNFDKEIISKKTKRLYGMIVNLSNEIGLRNDYQFLDIGCGNGNLTYFLNKNKRNCLGIDVQFKDGLFTKDLEEKNLIRKIEYLGKNRSNIFDKNMIYRWPINSESVDISFSASVIEHINNLEEFVIENARVMKKGAFCAHYFPSRFSLIEVHTGIPFGALFLNKIYYQIMFKFGACNNNFKSSKKAYEYMKVYTNYINKKKLIRIFQKNNFKLISCRNDLIVKFMGPKNMRFLSDSKFFCFIFGIFRSNLLVFRKI